MDFDATFLIAVISFVVFVIIMNAIFYAPILKIMQERNNFVENNFSDANNLKEKIKKQEQIHSSTLKDTRAQAHSVLDKEMKELQIKKSKIISDYKNELFKVNEEEKNNLRQSALQAKEILKSNVVDIAKNISDILLGNKIDANAINTSQVKIKEEQV